MPKDSKSRKHFRKRGVKNQYSKGFKPIGSVNSLYKNQVPRTLQIATRRNTKQVLKFVSNQTYKVVPGGAVGGMQNTFLRIRANSIYDIMQENGGLQPAGTFIPQDSVAYGPSVSPVNAEGFADWTGRYFHYTVLGSRIQATFEPTGEMSPTSTKVTQPTTFYINLAGGVTQIGVGTEMSAINKLPYTKRAQLMPVSTSSAASGLISSRNSPQGARLFMSYSTKKFEGVKDVADNDQFKGKLTTPVLPAEASYYTVGLRNTIPDGAASHSMTSGILRIKVEYITLLTEPTSTNRVQEGNGGIFGTFL
ncbi:MAG: putative capsid protein [Cressdnaviricota sp.]|nr:MAG: putative capsid protein [Cressdnaviricota sp.]